MNRALSWKRLLIVLGVFVVLSTSVFGVHRVQVKRHAAILKERAEREVAAAGGNARNTDEAVTLYARYLKFRPRDEDAYTQYAGLMLARADADPKKCQSSADALAAFLRQFPDHPSERCKLIDLYIKLGLFNTAREHLTVLFHTPNTNHSHDPALLDRSATCAAATGDLTKALEDLDHAIATGKAPLPMFERMLSILQANPSFRDPRFTVSKYLEKLLTEEPYESSIAARVVAGRFLLARKETEQARKHIEFALQKMPGGATNPDALLASAELSLADAARSNAEAHLQVAKGHLEKAFALAPKDVRIGLLLADIHANSNNTPQAVDVLRKTADALGEPNDQFLRVVDRLIDYGEIDQSGKLIGKLASNDLDRSRVVKYFRGRLAIVNKDWPQARKLLEEVAPLVARSPEFHKKALAGLAQCYAVLHNPDKQLENSRAALKIDPAYLPALIAEAESLSKLGRINEALPRYHVIVAGHKLESFRPPLLRLERASILMQPSGVRKWGTFDESLGPPEKRTPEIHIIHAEALAARGEQPKAAELLQTVLKTNPKHSAAWLALARLREGGRPEATLAALDAAKSDFGDSVELRLARAAVLAVRTKRPTPDEFRVLAATESLSKSEQHRLLFGIGEATMRAAAYQPDAASTMQALAIEFFERAAALEPHDLIARAILIDLGLMVGNAALVDRSLSQIAAVEGENGPIGTLGRIAARLPDVKKMEDKVAREAAVRELRAAAKRVREMRPAWGRISVALAQLDELEGLNDSALAHYREAIDRGDRQEFVIRRAVELYRERKQDDQAAALLNSLSSEVNLPDDLERFRVIKELLAKDIPSNTRPTIERIAPLNSTDYRVRLLRGALLAAIREDKDAEEAFRAAVAVGEHVPDTWTALVTHLARQSKTDSAKAAIAEAETTLRKKPLPTPTAKGELLVALAGCYETIGDLTIAAERYQQALQLAPRELNFHRHWIQFLQRHGRTKEASELLKQLVESPAQDLARWGRRNLALSLIVGGKAYSQRFAALKLIDINLKADPNDPEDVKARAVVQTIDPLTRDEGVRILREFASRFELTPDEFHLLGRMYFDQGRIAESLDFFVYAARPQPGVTLQHLASLIRVHLALNRVDLAASVLERLKTAAPTSWEAAREEAVILHRQSTDAEKRGEKEASKKLREQARERVLNFPNKDAAFVQSELAPTLEELGFLDDAEAAYTRLLDSKSPGAHLPLCVFLIHQKRISQAIELAKKFDTSTPINMTARLFSGAMRAKNPGGVDETFVEGWLNVKLRDYAGKPEFASLLVAKAELLESQEKYDAAIAEYRRSIELDSPDNSDVAKNNLAVLIALHKPAEVDDAIQIMTDLIGVRGPAPAYLDTRALAYLVKGTPELAVKDLELALAQQRKPLYLFHLGWAYDLISDKALLREKTLDEAKKLGMNADLLHPLELKKFGTRYGLGAQ